MRDLSDKTFRMIQYLVGMEGAVAAKPGSSTETLVKSWGSSRLLIVALPLPLPCPGGKGSLAASFRQITWRMLTRVQTRAVCIVCPGRGGKEPFMRPAGQTNSLPGT